MHVPATSKEIFHSLLDTYSEKLILQKLCDQIVWDFNRANLPIEIPVESTPEQIRQVVQNQLGKHSSTSIEQLLYLIDLPETIYRHSMHIDDSNEQLAQLILYREFVKIYYKLSYGKP
jgi:CHASE3 domain sensor protein